MVEKVSGSTTSDRRFLWCGMEICEERDSSGGTVIKRFFSQGVVDNGTALYYATDHLGSVRELTDGTGAIRARYDYDPYGRTTKVSGDKDSDYRYAGLFAHQTSGLQLAVFRAYDPALGRWINEDPVGIEGGLNLGAYVRGQPDRLVDPSGEIGIKKTMQAIALALGLIHQEQPSGQLDPVDVNDESRTKEVKDEAKKVGDPPREPDPKQKQPRPPRKTGPKPQQAGGGKPWRVPRGPGRKVGGRAMGEAGLVCLLVDCDEAEDILTCLIDPCSNDCREAKKREEERCHARGQCA